MLKTFFIDQIEYVNENGWKVETIPFLDHTYFFNLWMKIWYMIKYLESLLVSIWSIMYSYYFQGWLFIFVCMIFTRMIKIDWLISTWKNFKLSLWSFKSSVLYWWLNFSIWIKVSFQHRKNQHSLLLSVFLFFVTLDVFSPSYCTAYFSH